jgi:hypothetical protein
MRTSSKPGYLTIQPSKERFGIIQVDGVETFDEPCIGWRKEITGFNTPPLVAPQSRETSGGPQFKHPCALAPADPSPSMRCSSASQMHSSVRCILFCAAPQRSNADCTAPTRARVWANRPIKYGRVPSAALASRLAMPCCMRAIPFLVWSDDVRSKLAADGLSARGPPGKPVRWQMRDRQRFATTRLLLKRSTELLAGMRQLMAAVYDRNLKNWVGRKDRDFGLTFAYRLRCRAARGLRSGLGASRPRCHPGQLNANSVSASACWPHRTNRVHEPRRRPGRERLYSELRKTWR